MFEERFITVFFKYILVVAVLVVLKPFVLESDASSKLFATILQ